MDISDVDNGKLACVLMFVSETVIKGGWYSYSHC